MYGKGWFLEFQKTFSEIDMSDTPKPLLEHIIELRAVLFSCFAYITIGMVVTMYFSENIFCFLMNPLRECLKGENIVYTSITEPITTELRVAFYSSFLISFPFILRKIWSFVRVGLKESEILFIRRYGFIAFFLFIVGIVFAYYLAIPIIIKGLSTWSFSKNAIFLPKMSENISFILILMVSFGLSFQIPIIMSFMDKIGIVSFSKQQYYWREYVTTIIIISAIITPPDALSMLMLACPLIVLYVATILFIRLKNL